MKNYSYFLKLNKTMSHIYKEFDCILFAYKRVKLPGKGHVGIRARARVPDNGGRSQEFISHVRSNRQSLQRKRNNILNSVSSRKNPLIVEVALGP